MESRRFSAAKKGGDGTRRGLSLTAAAVVVVALALSLSLSLSLSLCVCVSLSVLFFLSRSESGGAMHLWTPCLVACWLAASASFFGTISPVFSHHFCPTHSSFLTSACSSFQSSCRLPGFIFKSIRLHVPLLLLADDLSSVAQFFFIGSGWVRTTQANERRRRRRRRRRRTSGGGRGPFCRRWRSFFRKSKAICPASSGPTPSTAKKNSPRPSKVT